MVLLVSKILPLKGNFQNFTCVGARICEDTGSFIMFQSVRTDSQSVRVGLRVRSLRTDCYYYNPRLFHNNLGLFFIKRPLLTSEKSFFQNVPPFLPFLSGRPMYRGMRHGRVNWLSLPSPSHFRGCHSPYYIYSRICAKKRVLKRRVFEKKLANRNFFL